MSEEEDLKNYKSFFEDVWSWSIEVLGEARAQQISSEAGARISTVRAAYAEALRAYPGDNTDWHSWSGGSLRDWNARALLERGLGKEFNTDIVPNEIAKAAFALDYESKKPFDPRKSSFEQRD